MIDAESFYKQNPEFSLGMGEPMTCLIIEQALAPSGTDPPQLVSSAIFKTDLKPSELTEDDLLHCSPTTLGFSLRDALWSRWLAYCTEITLTPTFIV